MACRPSVADDLRHQSTVARFISLVLAATVSVALLVYPHVVGRQMTPAIHVMLPVLLLATSLAFVHGVGYRPQRRWASRVVRPRLIWPVLVASAAWLVLQAQVP